jgi:hypothetical protein
MSIGERLSPDTDFCATLLFGNQTAVDALACTIQRLF